MNDAKGSKGQKNQANQYLERRPPANPVQDGKNKDEKGAEDYVQGQAGLESVVPKGSPVGEALTKEVPEAINQEIRQQPVHINALLKHYLNSAPFITIICFGLLAVTPYLLPLLALYLALCTGVLLLSLALLRAGRLPPLHGEALVMQRKIPLLVSSALPLAVIAALLTIHPLAVAAPDGVPADWVLALAVISIQMCALEDCTATIDRLTTASGNDHSGEKDGAA